MSTDIRFTIPIYDTVKSLNSSITRKAISIINKYMNDAYRRLHLTIRRESNTIYRDTYSRLFADWTRAPCNINYFDIDFGFDTHINEFISLTLQNMCLSFLDSNSRITPRSIKMKLTHNEDLTIMFGYMEV